MLVLYHTWEEEWKIGGGVWQGEGKTLVRAVD